eukprot:SAG11_NODE_15666_length_570_cov_0.878981_1_plen_71_part_10
MATVTVTVRALERAAVQIHAGRDCVVVGGRGAADNGIGEAGAVAVGKALESGQCALTRLDLTCESRLASEC